MDVLGLKVKLLGDAILDADTWVPQVALGLEHKQVRPGSLQSVLDFLGTKTSGTVYGCTTNAPNAKGWASAQKVTFKPSHEWV